MSLGPSDRVAIAKITGKILEANYSTRNSSERSDKIASDFKEIYEAIKSVVDE